MTTSRWPNWLVSSVSLFTVLLAWQATSFLVGGDALSGPWSTARALGAAANDGYLWSDTEITLLRLFAAAVAGFAVSVVAGLVLGLWPMAGRFFGLWVTIAASVPAVVYLVVCYLVIGVNDSAAVVAVAIIVAPSTTVTVWDGVRHTDPSLAEMSRSFGADRRLALKEVTFPQAAPWVLAAARGCWSLSWRIMVFAELIARPDGVGYRIQYWFNLANMPRVMASAVPLIAVIVVIDQGVFRVLERRITRWRPVEAR